MRILHIFWLCSSLSQQRQEDPAVFWVAEGVFMKSPIQSIRKSQSHHFATICSPTPIVLIEHELQTLFQDYFTALTYTYITFFYLFDMMSVHQEPH